MVEWSLQLSAKDNKNQGQVNSYAKELNKVYKFEERPDNFEGEFYGLEFNDRSFNYTGYDPDTLKRFKELVEKVVAHFPDILFDYVEFGDYPNIVITYTSKDGKLSRTEPSTMYVYTDNTAKYNEMVETFAPLLAARGYEFERKDAEQTISWAFDLLNGKSECDEIITAASNQLPGMLLVCYYTNDNCEDAFCIVEQCRALNGEYEWEELDEFLFCLADEASDKHNELPFTVSQAVAAPDECVKKIFDSVHSGNKKINEYLIRKALLHNISYMRFLHSDDKEWLLAMDSCTTDSIVLAGMYHSWRAWEDSYTDPDSGETVSIGRYELLDTPLFKSNDGETETLLGKVCKAGNHLLNNITDVVWILSNLTPLDYTRMLVENADNLGEDDRRWAYREIGDLYRWGKEEFGFFIDKRKAKECYDKAFYTDENPLEDSDDYGEPDPCTYTYTVKGEIAPLKELAEKIANKYGDVENELGLYVPINIFMHYLVGTDPKREYYCGNLLRVDEQDGALLLRIETERGETALAYALVAKFPGLEVEIEEELYEESQASQKPRNCH